MNIPDTSLHQSNQRGFSLIEVLVALVVLAIGLLGLASLQMMSIKFNSDSYLRTQATTLAYDIADRMRVNSAATRAGNYTSATKADADAKKAAFDACVGSTCNCYAGGNCGTANLATYDLGTWYQRVEAALPGATENRPTISFNAATNTATVTVNWRERDLGQSQNWEIQLWPY